MDYLIDNFNRNIKKYIFYFIMGGGCIVIFDTRNLGIFEFTHTGYCSIS